MLEDSVEFLEKTNADVREWMGSFYLNPENSNFNLHCLWAWQEQERRMIILKENHDNLLQTLELVTNIYSAMRENLSVMYAKDGWSSETLSIDQARAAIAKAKGE